MHPPRLGNLCPSVCREPCNLLDVSGATQAPPPSVVSQEYASWGRILFTSSRICDGSSLRDFYGEAVQAASFPALVDCANLYVQKNNDHGVSRAYARQQILEGHSIDKGLMHVHTELMRSAGIVPACAQVQEQHKHNFLQPDFVREYFTDFPEFEVLLSLSVDGAEIFYPPTWTPNMGVGVSVRKITELMADAVHVRMAQEQALGDVILITCEDFERIAREQGIQFYVTELGWMFKPGSKESDLLGRIIDDYTNGRLSLNTPESRLLMEAVYNELILPQLPDMCASILRARKVFPGQQIFGLKEDVSRAYRRVRLKPRSAVYMITLLPPDQDGVSYYAVRLSQPFGHNASGNAWGVVARAIK